MNEKIKKLITGKTLSEKIAVIGAALTLIVLIIDVIYTAIYSQYADFAVVLFLLAAIASWVAYFLVNDHPVLEWLNLLGVLFCACALALFVANSLNVWQDAYGGLVQNGELFGTFNFFNSEGGPICPAIIILIILGANVCGIISCFTSKSKKEGKVKVVDAQSDDAEEQL